MKECKQQCKDPTRRILYIYVQKIMAVASAYAVRGHSNLLLTLRSASPLRESVKECQPVRVVKDVVCQIVQESSGSDCGNVEDDYVVSCNNL